MIDEKKLLKFFSDRRADIHRGGEPTNGSAWLKGASRGPLLPVRKYYLPYRVTKAGRIPGHVLLKDKATGWLMIVSSGTGGAYRIPMIFTDEMMSNIKGHMDRVSTEDSEVGELKRISIACVYFEKLFRQKLNSMISDELNAYRVTTTTQTVWTQDCVDQAANGMCYLVILTKAGLMKHHTIYYPGLKASITPHWYTRIQKPNGEVLAIDLYHRSSGIGRGHAPAIAKDPAGGK